MSGESATRSCAWDSQRMAKNLPPILKAVPQRTIQSDKSQPKSQCMFLNKLCFPLARTPCRCLHMDWMHHGSGLKNSYMWSCHMEAPASIGLYDVPEEPMTTLSQIRWPAWYHAPQGPMPHHTPASAISDPNSFNKNLWGGASPRQARTGSHRLVRSSQVGLSCVGKYGKPKT